MDDVLRRQTKASSQHSWGMRGAGTKGGKSRENKDREQHREKHQIIVLLKIVGLVRIVELNQQTLFN